MRRTIVCLIALATAVTAAMLAGCGEGNTVTLPSATGGVTTGIPTGSQGQPTVDGAALYAARCAGCHGPLTSSSKTGATAARIQSAISAGIGGMGSLTGLTTQEVQAIATALGGAAPAPAPTPAPSPAPLDGAALYAAQCAGCHGPLATSAKRGATAARIQTAISAGVGGMGSLSALTTQEVQAIATALGGAAPAPAPTPAPSPAPLDGAALYAAQCAGCHGVLATSAKAGATAARIQTAINGNIGGMGGLSALTTQQVQAIADALTLVSPPSTPAPAPACGSCHAIPPASGHHSTHRSRSCATCHGSGYSSTTVNAATHNNGVKNLVTTIGWNAASRSCSNSCHGSKTW